MALHVVLHVMSEAMDVQLPGDLDRPASRAGVHLDTGCLELCPLSGLDSRQTPGIPNQAVRSEALAMWLTD